MDFPRFKQQLEAAFSRPLPGQDAQYQMTPAGRERVNLEKINQNNVKQAATAALFFEQNGRPHLILTRRVEYPGVHSGQISFPGGRKEPGDRDFSETALRETREEIGIEPDQISLLGSLTALYIPPSNFYVYPFVGLLKSKPDFTRQQSEVDEILTPDFNGFLDPSNLRNSTIKTSTYSIKVPSFHIMGETVWGATAMMISELRAMFEPSSP